MTINKQALRNTAEMATRHQSLKMTVDANIMLALLDELEAAGQRWSAQDDHINQQADRIEWLEQTNAGLGKALGAAEKRIAELEAREVVLPQRMEPEGYHIDEAYLVAAENGDYFDRDEVIEALTAAGISIKGE